MRAVYDINAHTEWMWL